MVVGTSEPQDFQLLDEGVPFVGTGFTVEIVWRGNAPAGPLSVAWISAADGTVRLTGTSQIAVGTYGFRWKLTDGIGQVGFIPNLHELHDTLRVVRA
jgi:hypothetical protein